MLDAADRRRLRHHDRAHRALAGVAVGASRPTRAAQPGAGHAARLRRPRSSCGSSPPRPVTGAPSPTTSRSTASHSKRASGSGCPGRWPTATRALFDDPDEVILDRKGNRHFSFGLGVHRCIGSNVARTVFKSMLTAVLDRMPDYRCDPDGTVHYETIGVIQGMQHLPATFTPGHRLGAASTTRWRSCSASVTSRGSPGRSPNARSRPSSAPSESRGFSPAVRSVSRPCRGICRV